MTYFVAENMIYPWSCPMELKKRILPLSEGHELKGLLLLGRKAMMNLDSVLKSKDITLTTEVHIVKAMAFPEVMYGYESWLNIKKWMLTNSGAGEGFESSLDSKEIKQINPNRNQFLIFIRRLMLKLKLQYFGYMM